jgi:imidazolonepropionase-like amidohydrolase
MSLLLALLLQAAADEPPVAITNVKILTVTRGDIESGTILLRGEKFADVGKDVKIPAGARTIDGKGLVAFPGMVNPVSRLGASEGPGAVFAGGGPGATPDTQAADEMNPASDAFLQALRTGMTTWGLHPLGGTVGGQGAILKPVGLQKEAMLVDRSAFLRINLQASTPSKEALRQSLEAAKRQLEAEKKAPKPSPPKTPDPALPVVRVLKGEIPALVAVGGGAEILHLWQVLDPYAEYKPRIVLVTSPESFKAAEELGRRKALVVLRPDLTFVPFTRDRVNPAADMVRAGATVAFTPGTDLGEGAEGYLFRVAEMVKYGLPRETALRAVTIAPAEMLGIEKRVGSIEAGKDADLLLFDGDPLAAGTHLRRVFINGQDVYRED